MIYRCREVKRLQPPDVLGHVATHGQTPRPLQSGRVTKRFLPDSVIALLCLAGAILTRLPVLERAVLDWDESLYFLMAAQWRAGHLPYTTIWDNKPIGIYAIFAIFQALIPGIAAIRVATIACVAVLAFTVFKITESLTASRIAAAAAAIVLLIGSLSNDGLSANTELFMASFTALAMLAALKTRAGFLTGLLLGLAFMVKYVMLFEAVVVLAVLLRRQPKLRIVGAAILGGALPLACAIALYAHAGRLGLWWDCSVLANLRRGAAPITRAALSYALSTQFWRWGMLYLCALALGVTALRHRRGSDILLTAWLFTALLGASAAKTFYDHFFLEALPVLCVIFGVSLARIPAGGWARPAFSLLILAQPIWAARTLLGNSITPDIPARIAADLRPAHPASLYVFDSEPIIYALTGTTPPTRYVLPSTLTGNFLPAVAGVNAPAEIARILAGKPQFILRRAPPPATEAAIPLALLARTLAAHYTLWRSYPGVQLFRLTR